MGILDRIKDIELEMARTQKNKATMSHLCLLKARLAQLRQQLLEPKGAGGGKGEGFDVPRVGDARVALIGFPSVGKSTLLTRLTGTESTAAAYEFTTLTCIPGNVVYKGTKIQLLDLPGIIEGAAEGKGRGRQVIAVAKSADLVLIVLDAGKEGVHMNHKRILENELEAVGIRLNKTPPNVSFRTKLTGGLKITSTVPLTKLGDEPEKTIYSILHEYKIHNAEVLLRQDVSPDELIDVVLGTRKYVRCMYVYNKVDTTTIEVCDMLARLPDSVVLSCHLNVNMDVMLAKMWEMLELVRIYTKKKGAPPDFSGPVILTRARGGYTIEAAVTQISKDILEEFNYAMVYGRSTKHNPQTCGLGHVLADEDVMQIVKKTASQQRHEKDYGDRAQAHFDKMKERNKKRRSGLKS